MPRIWIATQLIPKVLDAFHSGGWEIVPFAAPDLLTARTLQDWNPDVIICGVGEGPLPTGFEVTCREETAPILAIAANWIVAWQAIEAGASEAMVAPVEPVELLFRARKLIRSSSVVRTGELTIDLRSQRVTRRRQMVELSPGEFRLLTCLTQQIGKAQSYDQLLDCTHGCDPDSGGTPEQIKSCVKRLRKKIEPDPSQPQYVISVKGTGYCLNDQAQWLEAANRVAELPPQTSKLTPT